MTLQFIRDGNGNTTGVYIPIEDWQALKTKYNDLQQEETENVVELASWQKRILDERVGDYYQNRDNVSDFDETIDGIEKGI